MTKSNAVIAVTIGIFCGSPCLIATNSTNKGMVSSGLPIEEMSFASLCKAIIIEKRHIKMQIDVYGHLLRSGNIGKHIGSP